MDLDKYVKSYDDCYNLDNELMLNWYPNRVLEKATRGLFLELGLGHGHSANIFAKKFREYVVIEGSGAVIERFMSRYPESNIDFVNGFFENYITDKKFDNIGMGFVLEHVDDPRFILEKYKAYLKSNGSIFAAVPNGESLHRRIGYEAGLLKDMFSLTEADLAFGHKRIFSLDSLKKLVLDCGYTIASMEGIFLKPITTEQITQLNLSNDVLTAMLKVGVDYPELSNAILIELKVE